MRDEKYELKDNTSIEPTTCLECNRTFTPEVGAWPVLRGTDTMVCSQCVLWAGVGHRVPGRERP